MKKLPLRCNTDPSPLPTKITPPLYMIHLSVVYRHSQYQHRITVFPLCYLRDVQFITVRSCIKMTHLWLRKVQSSYCHFIYLYPFFIHTDYKNISSSYCCSLSISLSIISTKPFAHLQTEGLLSFIHS